MDCILNNFPNVRTVLHIALWPQKFDGLSNSFTLFSRPFPADSPQSVRAIHTPLFLTALGGSFHVA